MTYYLLMHACRSLPLNVPRARLKAAHVYEENSEYDMDHLAISASCNDRRLRARCRVSYIEHANYASYRVYCAAFGRAWRFFPLSS